MEGEGDLQADTFHGLCMTKVQLPFTVILKGCIKSAIVSKTWIYVSSTNTDSVLAKSHQTIRGTIDLQNNGMGGLSLDINFVYGLAGSGAYCVTTNFATCHNIHGLFAEAFLNLHNKAWT